MVRSYLPFARNQKTSSLQTMLLQPHFLLQKVNQIHLITKPAASTTVYRSECNKKFSFRLPLTACSMLRWKESREHKIKVNSKIFLRNAFYSSKLKHKTYYKSKSCKFIIKKKLSWRKNFFIELIKSKLKLLACKVIKSWSFAANFVAKKKKPFKVMFQFMKKILKKSWMLICNGKQMRGIF